MIINNSKNFVFIHVPKAAGTSITKTLSKFTTYKDLEIGGTDFGERVQPAYKKRFGLSKHSTCSEIRDVTGNDIWDSFFKFSFVRNPYKRTLSTFNFLRQWEGTPSGIKEIMHSFKSFDEYVDSDLWEKSWGPDNIFRPQAYWLTDKNDRDSLIVDYFGKIENINEEMKFISSKLNLEIYTEIPKLNTSAAIDQDLGFSKQAIEKINFYYKRDFEIFSYDMLEV